MQPRTVKLRALPRDGSKSLIQHLKSFLRPSQTSKSGGKMTTQPWGRRPPGAPTHLCDALLVAPLGDQGGAMIGGPPCRIGSEPHVFGEHHRLFSTLLGRHAVTT